MYLRNRVRWPRVITPLISRVLSVPCISHSAKFKNTTIELLKTSTDLEISKGVDALKQLFLKKRRIQFSAAVSASKKKNACALNPRPLPGWNRHPVNSAAPPGLEKI